MPNTAAASETVSVSFSTFRVPVKRYSDNDCLNATVWQRFLLRITVELEGKIRISVDARVCAEGNDAASERIF